MSQPTPYTPSTDFSQQEAINASGRSTVNTSALDAELANIETTLDQALANMALLQRDDGRLKDMACELHTISPEVLNLMGGFRARGLWTADTAYSAKDIASNAEYAYLCKTAHTSGSEFDEQFWTQFGFSGGSDAAQAAAAAQVSANNASLSAGAAATSAGAANTAAGAAATQAGSAATSAGTATTQAGNAATSATNASNSAAAAQTAAANLPNAPAAGADKFLKSNADGTVWEYLTALAARAALGLGIGTNVQAYVAPGTAGNVLISNGKNWASGTFVIADGSIIPAKLSQKMTQVAAVMSTSGTSIDFTGLPSWVKQITFCMHEVSTNSTSPLLLQGGVSAGVVTTGYASSIAYSPSAGMYLNSVNGFACTTAAHAAAAMVHGQMIMTNLADNIWTESVGIFQTGSIAASGGGSVALPGTLDRIRLTTVSGTATLDRGIISLLFMG